MARRGFQQGSLFQRGTRRKLWVARWWEDVIQADGTLGRLRRSEVIGTVAEFPTRRLAMQVLSQRLGSINSGKARPQSVRTFGDFVKNDWMPVVLPTLKYATQKHYRYMLDVHLIPAFGKRAASRTHAGRAAKLSQPKAQAWVVVGNRSPFQVWSEQDSRRSRRMGLCRRECRSENETPTTAAWNGESVLTAGQVRDLLGA